MNKFKYTMVLVVVLFNVMAANAQTMRRISSANELAEYKADYIEQLGGMRHDEIVMVLPDSTVAWKAETIDGFYMGGKLGGGYDFGDGNSIFGYNASVSLGYTTRLVDWEVSAGYSQLANQDGKAYGAFNAFFEPSISLCKWGKNDLETNKLYLGIKLGVQECKDGSLSHYEDENVIINGNDDATSMGFAGGVKLGWEKRKFMGATRMGIEISAHLYDTSNTFSLTTNGIQRANESEHKFRYFVGATFYVKGIFHKKAKNY
ncbi:MAG: hypothetical protein IJ529_01605 [Alphaproteobacteria bacterium]|nr:hypothetical protein [Alphaproteobacteria bacterium]